MNKFCVCFKLDTTSILLEKEYSLSPMMKQLQKVTGDIILANKLEYLQGIYNSLYSELKKDFKTIEQDFGLNLKTKKVDFCFLNLKEDCAEKAKDKVLGLLKGYEISIEPVVISEEDYFELKTRDALGLQYN